MKGFSRTDRFRKCYKKLPTTIRKKTRRQLRHLAEDIRHPSLYAKKIQGRADIWEARVDIHHRMTFQINDECIILRAVGPHDILKKP
jgi:mRNA interferase RelE/StbE